MAYRGDLAKRMYLYFAEYSEPVKTIKGHRVLAITRGEREECLTVKMTLDREGALARLASRVIVNKNSPVVPFIMAALTDSYDRLIFPSLEREVRAEDHRHMIDSFIKDMGDGE